MKRWLAIPPRLGFNPDITCSISEQRTEATQDTLPQETVTHGTRS